MATLTVLPELLRTAEVAKRLNVSGRTVLFWAQKGWPGSIVTPGGHRRYPASSVEAAWSLMYEHAGQAS